jgi:hypothetical protein
VTDQAPSPAPRKPLLTPAQTAVLAVGVLAIAGYAVANLYPRSSDPPEQAAVPPTIVPAKSISADEQALGEQGCDTLIDRFAKECPDVLKVLGGSTCNANLTDDGTYVDFGGEATFLIDAEQRVVSITAAAAEACPALPWAPALETRLCEQLSAALGERCPNAGGLAVEACAVIDEGSNFDITNHGVGAGRYVHFGTGPMWFVDAENTVLAANDVADLLCPEMRTMKERARQRARDRAVNARQDDPTACSIVDLAVADEVMKHALESKEPDDTKAEQIGIQRAAKSLGMKRDAVDALWLKAVRICPLAL